MLTTCASILFSLEGSSYGTSLLTCIVFALLCSNGGGFFIRDLLILRRTPSLLLSPIEIFAYCWVACETNHSCLSSNWLPLFDLIGIEVYVYDALYQPGKSPIVCILCGFFSGIGGGLIAGLVHGDIKHLRDFVTSNRIFALLVSILMYSSRGPVFVLPILFALWNPGFRRFVKCGIVKLVSSCRVNEAIWKGSVINYMPCLVENCLAC